MSYFHSFIAENIIERPTQVKIAVLTYSCSIFLTMKDIYNIIKD